MKRIGVLFLAVVFLAGSFGCSSMNKTEKGAVIGGAAGAVLGGVIGSGSGNTAVGAIVGAAVGGTAGAVIGNYMDNQADEIAEEVEGAEVERVGEGIKITFDSGILFAVNKSDLTPNARTNLTNLASILQKYEDTDILIEGHTDADGTEEYNQALSERRADAVKAFLVNQGVTGVRMTTVGYGEMQPIDSNETAAGKTQNRRVEVAIMANEELQERAIREAEGGE